MKFITLLEEKIGLINSSQEQSNITLVKNEQKEDKIQTIQKSIADLKDK